nr:hypothetical protein CFP56_38536 [Quercus suber]
MTGACHAPCTLLRWTCSFNILRLLSSEALLVPPFKSISTSVQYALRTLNRPTHTLSPTRNLTEDTVARPITSLLEEPVISSLLKMATVF